MTKPSGRFPKVSSLIAVAVLIALSGLVYYQFSTFLQELNGSSDEAKAYRFFSYEEERREVHKDNKSSNNHESAGTECWDSLVGYWQGRLTGTDLRLLYRVTSTPGKVFLYSLDQFGLLIGASATRLDCHTGEASFFFTSIDGVFRAKLSEDGGRLKGNWKQLGQKFPLEVRRFHYVPHELDFLLNKIVSGSPKELLEMKGYWSGYLEDHKNDDNNKTSELVILEVEPIGSGALVEPKLFLPSKTALPIGIRSFLLDQESNVKLVLDSQYCNAIFYGKLETNNDRQAAITGTVHYDDVDETSPLKLVYSKERPGKVIGQQVKASALNAARKTAVLS